MKSRRSTVLGLISIFVLPGMALAQSAVPAGSQSQPSQSSSPNGDTTAALAAVKKLQAEAGGVSTASSQALQDLHQQDAQDSADTSAAVAVLLKKIKQAADNVDATAPDADTINKSQALQRRRELDAESKKDGELFKEWVLGKALTTDFAPNADRSASLNDVAKKLVELSDAAEEAKAFIDASTSSFTAGPTEDEGPLFTPEETQSVNDKMNAFTAAQQILQQNMQQLDDLMSQQAAKNRIPTPTQVQQSGSPQLKRGSSSDCDQTAHRCR
jgi:hypothetical protein